MRALVLIKALPPTRGHERLIEFALTFSDKGVVVIDTAPDEPLVDERLLWARCQVILDDWSVKQLEIDDQDPESPGFWDRWKGYLDTVGTFDYVIGSEPYCAKVAEVIGAAYIPYDPDRELEFTRGTTVRLDPLGAYSYVAPTFQRHLQTTVTIWGAESTGKTTLSKSLADWFRAEWTFEWARPYLEATGRTVCDLDDMHNIWHGQFAVENNAEMYSTDKPYVVRDTDLYSTIGYWEQPHWTAKYGPVPDELISDAKFHKADLYIITQSNIPFEKDPLRYGGDHRESPDEYWISVAEKYDLNYVVLTETDRRDRLDRSKWLLQEAFYNKNKKLTDYHRV